MSVKPKVTVVIPNWNGLVHLPECLEALDAQTFRDFETVVVDNDSGDGSVPWLEQHAPSVRVVQREDNGGFSKAVNAGINDSQAPYVALLNNDTHAHERWLEEVVSALERHPEYDFAASLMMLYYEDDAVNAAGDVYDFWHMNGRNRGFGSPAVDFAEPKRVLGACAGAAVYRRSLFDAIGLFDEDYFLMSEDTDINLRALVAGKKCLYVPTSIVRHKLRSSIESQPSAPMERLALRNEAMTFAKNVPWPALICSPLLWLFTEFRNAVPLRPSKWHLIPASLRRVPGRFSAQREGWRMGWSKRGDVYSRRRIGALRIMRWLVNGTGSVSD